MRDGKAVTDAIGPLALAVPMIAFAFRTNWQIGGSGADSAVAGWLTLGAPVTCGLLALGIAALAVQRDSSSHRPAISNSGIL